MGSVARNWPFNNNDCLRHVLLVDPVNDLEDLRLLLSALLVALPAVHLRAREDSSGSRRAIPDGTILAEVLGTVGLRTLRPAVDLDSILPAQTSSSSMDVNEIAFREEILCLYLLADLPLFPLLRPDPELLLNLERRKILLCKFSPNFRTATLFVLVRNMTIIANPYGVNSMLLGPLLVCDNISAALHNQDGGGHLLPNAVFLHIV
mmetsp:Transcript_71675/g.134035  ORF Transcript_71675/g.134035 Transcript_71675/m.134035 type:complete len:206 (-) Transcript_71675:423-1040(-)